MAGSGVFRALAKSQQPVDGCVREARQSVRNPKTLEQASSPAAGAAAPAEDAGVAATHTVVIYVSDHCANCEYAREVAAFIRTEYPWVHLRMVDLATPEEVIPDSVFATPTYLLDDRVWWLGNPSLRQVRETLDHLEGKN